MPDAGPNVEIDMPGSFRLTLAQMNSTRGAIAANAALAQRAWEAARDANSQMLALPELFLTGDLGKRALAAQVAEAMAAVEGLAVACAPGPAIGLGAPWAAGGKVFNAYCVLSEGRVQAVICKHHLPRRERWAFSAGPIAGPCRIGPLRIGVPLDQDAWQEDVAEAQAESGAEILLVPNALAHVEARHDLRLNLMVARVIETGLPLIWLNAVGEHDGRVLDGASFVLNPGGGLAHQLPAFDESLTHVDFSHGPDGWRAIDGPKAILADGPEQQYQALVEGLGDHLRKGGHGRVVVAVSHDTLSALAAAVATDAIGPASVHCICDVGANGIAEALGTRLDMLSVDPLQQAVERAVEPLFSDGERSMPGMSTRSRELLLATISERTRALILNPVTKTDLALGAGEGNGYNPFRNIYSSQISELCEWRNAHHRGWMMGPTGTVLAPTTPIAATGGTGDPLPPQPALDAIIAGLVERDATIADLVAEGFGADAVQRVAQKILSAR